MKLVSMKMTPAERKEAVTPSDYKPPEYPYGLRVTLDSDALEKLGISKLPDVGTEFELVARVEVCARSEHESEGSRNKSMELQLTDVALGEPATEGKRAKVLYGDSAKG